MRTAITPEGRTAAVQRVDLGEATSVVAADLGVHPSTVRRWVRTAHDAAPVMTSDPVSVDELGPDVIPGLVLESEPFTAPVAAVAEGSVLAPKLEAAAEPTAPATIPAEGNDVSQVPAYEPVAAPSAPGPTEPNLPDSTEQSHPDEILGWLGRLPVWARYLLAALAWGASVAASTLAPADLWARPVVVTVHVLGVVMAAGAVFALDWHGLLWLTRRRRLHESTRLAAALTPVIWIGLGLTFVTGSLLGPSLTQPVTWVKLIAVLLLTLNGVATAHTQDLLNQAPPGVRLQDLRALVRLRLVASAALSQVAWLVAIVIGVSNTMAL